MIINTKYRYSVDPGDAYQDAFQLGLYDWQNQNYDLADEWDLETLVELCAKDFYRYHDGWECGSWCDGSESMSFWIWTDETTRVKYQVSLEYEPVFSVHKQP